MAASQSAGARPPRSAAWFERRPSNRGIRPVSWKGWALVVGYLAVLLAAVIAMPRPDAMDPVAFAAPLIGILAVMGVATIVFVLLVRRLTATDD